MMSMFQGLMVKPAAKPDKEDDKTKSESGERGDESSSSLSTGFSFLNTPVAAQPQPQPQPHADSHTTTTAEPSAGSGASTSFSFIDSTPQPQPKATVTTNESNLSGSLLAGLKIHSQSQDDVEEVAGGGSTKVEEKEQVVKKSGAEGEGSFPEAGEGEGEDPFASVLDSDDEESVGLENGGVGGGVVEDDKEYEFVQNEETTATGADSEFGQLLAAFRRSVGKYSKEIGDMNMESAENSKKQSGFEEELKETEAALFSAEASQNTASQAEDFAKAEQLQKEIDSLSRRKGELQSGLDKVLRRDKTLQKQRAELFENQISSIETIRSLLQDCSLKETKRAEDHKKISEEQFARKISELKDEEDLLRMRTEHIMQDLGVLEKEEEQINAKISSGTESLREERSEWEGKMADVSREIEVLEAQLQEKYDQRIVFTDKIANIDNDIDGVKAKYETRVGELDARRRAVESKQSEVGEGKERISVTRERLLEERESEASKSEELKTMAASVVSQLVILEKISDRLREETLSRKQKMESSAEDVAAMEELKEGLKVAAQTINVLKSQLSQKETTVMELTSKLLQVENKLPSLNEQKRLAVSARNFKQAARVAAQIKALASEKESIDEGVEEANNVLVDLQARIDNENEIIAQTTATLEKLEKDLAKKKLSAVLHKSQTLQNNLREVKELGSIEQGTFGGTVVQLLTTDIESCSLEANELSNKLGDSYLSAAASMSSEQEDQDNPGNTNETRQTANQEDSSGTSSDTPDAMESTGDVDQKIAQLSAGVEKAVESEDYELAAELEEELKALTDKKQRGSEGGLAVEYSSEENIETREPKTTDESNSQVDAKEPIPAPEVDVARNPS